MRRETSAANLTDLLTTTKPNKIWQPKTLNTKTCEINFMQTKPNKNSNILKNHAIVLNAIDGTKIEEYAYVIGNIIDPKNILYVSRISLNRICIYLTNKNIVEELTSKTKQ